MSSGLRESVHFGGELLRHVWAFISEASEGVKVVGLYPTDAARSCLGS